MKGKKLKYNVYATQGQGGVCVAEKIDSYAVKKLVDQIRGTCSIMVKTTDGDVVTEKFV